MKNADYIITPDLPVIKAIEQINRNSQGIVYLCEAGRLVGVVTDGDIRRYIDRKPADGSDRNSFSAKAGGSYGTTGPSGGDYGGRKRSKALSVYADTAQASDPDW